MNKLTSKSHTKQVKASEVSVGDYVVVEDGALAKVISITKGMSRGSIQFNYSNRKPSFSTVLPDELVETVAE